MGTVLRLGIRAGLRGQCSRFEERFKRTTLATRTSSEAELLGDLNQLGMVVLPVVDEPAGRHLGEMGLAKLLE